MFIDHQGYAAPVGRESAERTILAGRNRTSARWRRDLGAPMLFR
jgi:hypothetical protein